MRHQCTHQCARGKCGAALNAVPGARLVRVRRLLLHGAGRESVSQSVSGTQQTEWPGSVAFRSVNMRTRSLCCTLRRSSCPSASSAICSRFTGGGKIVRPLSSWNKELRARAHLPARRRAAQTRPWFPSLRIVAVRRIQSESPSDAVMRCDSGHRLLSARRRARFTIARGGAHRRRAGAAARGSPSRRQTRARENRRTHHPASFRYRKWCVE